MAQTQVESKLDRNDIDTINEYILFKNRLVLYSDIGYISSPFNLVFRDPSNVKHSLNYRINHGLMLGIGGSYKWISLRLSYMILNNLENIKKYGKTNFLGLQLDIPIKRMYFELDLFRVQGYALNKANKKIPEISSKTLIFPDIATLNINVAGYYFFNRAFDINSMKGRSGHFKSRVNSVYLKGNFGYSSVSNNNDPIIPNNFLDLDNINRFQSNNIGALEFGVVPGYTYVNRLKNWQFSGLFGLGASIQHKFYTIDDHTRTFIGFAPRIDAKVNVGYNPVNWFIMLGGELDFKQIKFTDLIYRNLIYNIKLTGGYRFKIKKSRRSDNTIKFSEGTHTNEK